MTDFVLNTCQQAVVSSFIKFLMNPDEDTLVVSGFAGTGKTTVIKYLLDNIPKYEQMAQLTGNKIKHTQEIAITATTRKAAKVISDSFDVEPLTIHSYLGLLVRNNFSTGETFLDASKAKDKKENALIIIDEASFINQELMNYIRMLTEDCKIVFLGDPCQLIPVNEKHSPVFDSGLPTKYLKTVMRNQGAIEQLSAQYRNTVLTQQWQPPVIDGELVKHVDGLVFQDMIDKAFLDNNFTPDKSAKIVAWTNDRVNQYNAYVRELRGSIDLYKEGETLLTNKPILSPKTQNIMASTDEPVRVLRVRRDVEFNVPGFKLALSCGTTVFTPEDKNDQKWLLKECTKEKNWKQYFHIKDHWADLRPVYASTVHKSQGSTYDTVFVDLSDIGRCTNSNDAARLLYVAISRASKHVVLYGELPQHYLGKSNVPKETEIPREI